ncbi:PLP-dependent aspartate aminotransferase family protein [Amylibacter sp. IMCC11727]|uniref:trans-sulfuration enzyme family protein n=1 Tax=Amylibacter sp. IMCC11727 TaxID=3039851 RepID=UPI00244D9F09|nr:PLP-dependent aspartate aminotransferase family protein [Amylibacter sp. IMCC11727]WGI22923.1 PLP-dependent aspartate aminotransferase family protein [Amylibacter sp. IMCC11727]
MKKNSLAPETLAAQALRHIDEATGSVVPPMLATSTFARDENYDLREGYIYSRYAGPTTTHAEEIIAALEGSDDSLLFNSGMSASVAVVEALPPQAHVVAQGMMYHVGLQWLDRQAARGVISLDHFPAGDLDALADQIQPGKTKLVWIETPANGDWSITDIAAAAELAHAAGAILMVDSTAAPPCTQKPLDLGADISFHSATKYMGGHSDFTAGVLSARTDLHIWDEIRNVRSFQGTILPAFEAWLLIRSLRTLHIRYAACSSNAMAFAKHFAAHRDIETVLYPGLPTHPSHHVAANQMHNGFGGMMSILINGKDNRAFEMAKKTELFIPATSLGGVESLIEHRRTVAGPDSGIPDNLLRISIGIEHIDDLIADFEQALGATAHLG